MNEKGVFKKVTKEQGEPVTEMLLNVPVYIDAIDREGLNALIRIGDKTRHIELKDLGSKQNFSSMIRPYSCYASGRDYEFMLNFWRETYETNLTTGKTAELVYLKNYQGRLTDGSLDCWILAKEIYQRGELVNEYEYIADFKIGSKRYYIDNTNLTDELKLQCVQMGERGQKIEAKDLIKDWLSQYGNKELLYCALGWFSATIYMQEVMDAMGAKRFPMFAVSGITQTGKTSLLTMLMRFWGMNVAASDYTQISPFVELGQLSSMHNGVIWRDEYRDRVGQSINKENILRSLYDRSTITKGTASQDYKLYRPGAAFLLSGEDVTLDPAIRRRFIYFMLHQSDKITGTDWEVAQVNSELYNWRMFYHAIEHGFDKRLFNKYQKESKSKVVTSNDTGEMSVVYGALAAVWGEEIAEDAIRLNQNLHISGGASPIDELRNVNIAEQFLEFTVMVLSNKSYWNGRTIGGDYQRPQALTYFRQRVDGRININSKALIEQMFKDGFCFETKLSKAAVRKALFEMLKPEDKVIKMGKESIRGWIVDPSIFNEDHPLSLIISTLNETMKEVMVQTGKLTLDLDI